MTRKLVTIKTITDIQPIPNADAIEVATVDHGWKVVVKKEDNYKVRDRVLYFEPDSWVPHKIAPFLSKGKEPREYEGVIGERLKTIKPRGQISQGLILKFGKQNPALSCPWSMDDGVVVFASNIMNDDLTFIHPENEEHLAEILNVKKWEAPIPAQLGGQIKGNFPGFIPKTDQERCQNLYVEIFGDHATEHYEVTEKLDGTSMTVYAKDGEVGVCGRNWNLTEDDSNSLWATAKSIGLIDYLKNYNGNIAIQGELIGEGIQKNYYGIKGHRFYVYDVYDINEGGYWGPVQRKNWVDMVAQNLPELLHVPVVDPCYDMCKAAAKGIDGLLEAAEGLSVLNPKREREGIVFKSHDSQFHFKAISNKFLLKGGN